MKATGRYLSGARFLTMRGPYHVTLAVRVIRHCLENGIRKVCRASFCNKIANCNKHLKNFHFNSN